MFTKTFETMRLFYHCFTTLAVLVLMSSCKTYKERNEALIESYPAIVQPHFRSFCESAYEKGLKLDLKKLKVHLTTAESKGDTWDGAYYADEHAIYLDTNCMNFRNNLEMLCWHELGHGILKREHNSKVIRAQDGRVSAASFMNVNCGNDGNEEMRGVRIEEMFSVGHSRHVAHYRCNH